MKAKKLLLTLLISSSAIASELTVKMSTMSFHFKNNNYYNNNNIGFFVENQCLNNLIYGIGIFKNSFNRWSLSVYSGIKLTDRMSFKFGLASGYRKKIINIKKAKKVYYMISPASQTNYLLVYTDKKKVLRKEYRFTKDIGFIAGLDINIYKNIGLFLSPFHATLYFKY